jgi:polyhydroxyalkanoate synthesis regulator phasin
MMDYMKKAMLIGMGIAAATREKIEEITAELVKKGELSEKEGKEMMNDLLERSRKMKEDMEKRVEKIVSDTLVRFNIPTRKEWSELKERIEALEKKRTKTKESKG